LAFSLVVMAEGNPQLGEGWHDGTSRSLHDVAVSLRV